MQSLKGRSSRKLQLEYKHLKKQFWNRHLWARGYFVCTTGNVTDEVVKEYIETQEIKRGVMMDFVWKEKSETFQSSLDDKLEATYFSRWCIHSLITQNSILEIADKFLINKTISFFDSTTLNRD